MTNLTNERKITFVKHFGDTLRGVEMKYIVAFFWTFVLGEIIGYIGSALESTTYNATATSLFAVVIGMIGTIAYVAISKSAAPHADK